MRWCVAWLMAVALGAVEARLTFPDPVIPGTPMQGELVISDAPSPPTAVVLPTVPGVELQVLAGGRNETRIVNGVQSSTRAIPIAIRVAAEGPFTIPAFTTTLRDGSTLTVPPTSGRAAPGDAHLTGEVVAKARFVPERIVPGEAASLVYDIWLRRGSVQTLGINPPAEALSLGERTIVQGKASDAQGQEWAKVTITWPITFAAPGTYRVSGQQEIQVQVGDGFFNQRVATHRTGVAAAAITVTELPSAGRPADFTGLVGETTVTSTLERSAIAAGEGARFAVTVRTRQADLVRRPALTLPAGVAIYPVEDVAPETAGSRTFRWDVVPAAPGVISIPAVAVPWFDPVAQAYRRAEAPALTLTVRPGRARDLGLVGQATAPTATMTPAISGPSLPDPLRQPRADAPPPVWAVGAAGLGALLGIGLGAWCRRTPRARHRGQALALALRRGEVPQIAAALAALRPALTSSEHLAAATALETALEAHRFGGQALPDTTAWRHTLEVVA